MQVSTLKTQTSNAIAYSLDMLSFLFLSKGIGKSIQVVHLFGSAARGELHAKSDIDLFIECPKEDEENIKKITDAAILKFMRSDDYKKWKLFYFTYPFAVQAGVLEEWDLKQSITSEGIVLYDLTSKIPTGKRQVLFVIQYPPIIKKYVALRRLLFGRDEEEYKSFGLVRDLGGEKLSPHVFMVPTAEQSRMIDILSKENINFRMKEVVLLRS